MLRIDRARSYGAPVSDPGSEPSVALEPPAVSEMRELPSLALVSALAALVDLAWNRVGVRLLDPHDRELWVPLVRHGHLVRNLAVLAGIVALAASLFSLLRVPSPLRSPWRSFGMRLTIAAVAGLYAPSIVLAALTPREHVPNLVVVLGLLAGNALVAVLGSASLPYRRAPAAWTSLAAGLTALLAMTGLVVASVRVVVPAVGVLGLVARHGSELGWLLTPLPLLLDPELRAHLRRQRGRAALGLGVVLGCLALGVLAQLTLHADVARYAYGAFRIAMLPAEGTWLYALPLGLTLGLAAVQLLWLERRQLGVALLFWVAAGLAPRSPPGTLYEVLAALLLARAALVAHPDGRARLARPLDLEA